MTLTILLHLLRSHVLFRISSQTGPHTGSYNPVCRTRQLSVAIAESMTPQNDFPNSTNVLITIAQNVATKPHESSTNPLRTTTTKLIQMNEGKKTRHHTTPSPRHGDLAVNSIIGEMRTRSSGETEAGHDNSNRTCESSTGTGMAGEIEKSSQPSISTAPP